MFACSALNANFLLTLSSGLHTVTLYDGNNIEPNNFSSSGPETNFFFSFASNFLNRLNTKQRIISRYSKLEKNGKIKEQNLDTRGILARWYNFPTTRNFIRISTTFLVSPSLPPVVECRYCSVLICMCWWENGTQMWYIRDETRKSWNNK